MGECKPRRLNRRREIGELMRCAALGGLAAGFVVCVVRWPSILAGTFLPAFHPLALAACIIAAGGAIAVALAGSLAHPLYLRYGPGSASARWLSFAAGTAAVPLAAVAIMLWNRLAS